MRPLVLIILLTVTLCCCTRTGSVFPETYGFSLAPDNLAGNSFMHMRLLDSVGLRLKTASGEAVTELSGLAWDEDEELLYAVSDEGVLHHLRLEIVGDHIEKVQLISSFPLLDKEGDVLSTGRSDSEGLALLNGANGRKGDSLLLVSFEHKPRVVRYTPRGEFIAGLELPRKLRAKKNYRGNNKMLESVVVHEDFGVLTAAEYPLRDSAMDEHTLYGVRGREFHFPASGAKKSAVTGLTTLENGNILVLERAWAGLQYPIVISLREVKIWECDSRQRCPVKDLAVLSSAEGWYMDNFEGITHYRDDRYLMVSDDNRSSLQSTILVFFSLLPESAGPQREEGRHP